MKELVQENKIWGIPVTQNQQDFVLGVFSISQMLKFTRYTKRLIVGYDEENEPVYNPSIQRELESSRVEQIADFLIEEREATFPTNIVLHIPAQVIIEQQRHSNFLDIYLDAKVFQGIEIAKASVEAADIYITIIDGQHRVRGVEVAIERLQVQIQNLQKTLIKSPDSQILNDKLNYYVQRLKDLLNIQLVVSFFIDKSLEYQAMIFSTINRPQKRVSESLVSSLFGLTTSDSPQKTSLQIVLALNAHPKSPFYNRVNLYGAGYIRGQSPPLTQAGMINSIVALISEDLRRSAENDRRIGRTALLSRTPGSLKRLPFRKYYAKNQDSKISDILFLYFTAGRKTFLKSDGTSFWDFNPENTKPSNVLHTTVGYQALLKILVDILEILESNEEAKFNEGTYIEYLKPLHDINWADTMRYPFTSKTATILYLDMSLRIWPTPFNANDQRQQKLKEALEKVND